MTDIKRTSSEDPDFCNLIKLLDQDLWERYPKTQQNYTLHNTIKSDAKVVIVYDNGKPVGCGCFKETEEDKTVEIKRMFVMEQVRGKGIATIIIHELEKWAVEEGKNSVILETGINQPEAIALYTKLGYQRINNYGSYINNTESVCLGKDLKKV